MISPRIATLAIVFVTCAASAALLAARGQQTLRPGDPTEARVFVENRSPNEAVPVVIERMPDVRVHVATVDPSVTVPMRLARQGWEYRAIPLSSSADPAQGLLMAGNEGWEAVGVLQSGAAGVTLLVKRPR